MSDEPLYCCFCGLEYCDCEYPKEEGEERPFLYCEICGGKEPCGCEYSSRV